MFRAHNRRETSAFSVVACEARSSSLRAKSSFGFQQKTFFRFANLVFPRYENLFKSVSSIFV